MDIRDNIKVGVLMGGWSDEREVSLSSGQAIIDVLVSKGWNVVGIDVTREICESIKRECIDVAFLAMHGCFGEDGTLQGMLELMGIPYTGSNVLASSLAIDKIMTKTIFHALDIPTPDFKIIDEDIKVSYESPFGYPVVVKPSCQGSTIGVHIVEAEDGLKDAIEDALKHDENIFLEKFIRGRDVTVGIIDKEPLPLIEIIPRSGFYDFFSKYTPGETEYLCPAPIDQELSDHIQKLALSAYNALRCRDFCRVDFRLGDDRSIFCLEVNTIPGMTKTSLLPKAAEKKGISFDCLVEKILLLALNRRG